MGRCHLSSAAMDSGSVLSQSKQRLWRAITIRKVKMWIVKLQNKKSKKYHPKECYLIGCEQQIPQMYKTFNLTITLLTEAIWIKRTTQVLKINKFSFNSILQIIILHGRAIRGPRHHDTNKIIFITHRLRTVWIVIIRCRLRIMSILICRQLGRVKYPFQATELKIVETRLINLWRSSN